MILIYIQAATCLNITLNAQPSKSARVICNKDDTAIIITSMDSRLGHTWKLSIAEARTLQSELSSRVVRSGDVVNPRYIAGIDVSASRFSKSGRASIVVLDASSLHPVETCCAEGALHFPYIPGYLSFREAPLIMEAWQKLKTRPDLLMVDGQGIAHPRRFGIATHLGLLLDMPSVGCAKSRLTGQHAALQGEAGSCSLLTDNGEVIGAVVRTKGLVKPLYISIGHKIGLESAIHWVLKCCRGFRLPEPTRLAHLAAGGPDSMVRVTAGRSAGSGRKR